MTQEESKFPRPVEAVLVILVGFFASFIPLSFIFGTGADPGEIMADAFRIKIALVIGEFSLLVIPLIYLLRRRMPLTFALRLQPVPQRIFILSIAVSLSLIVILDEVDRLVQYLIPMPEEVTREMMRVLKIENEWDFVLILLSAVILAAIVEETIFRGFLQQAFEEHLDVTRGVIYASLAWTLIHANLYASIQIFLFGFFLGWLAWRTNSIYPSMIGHALNNTIAIWYINADHSEPIPIYEWGDHVSPFLLIFGIGIAYQGIRIIDSFYRHRSPGDQSSNISESS